MNEDKLEKSIGEIGNAAMKEAEKNGTYIVYMDDEGYLVHHYPNGKIERIKWIEQE